MEIFEKIYNWLMQKKVEKSEENFIRADEAFIQGLDLKHQSRKEFEKKLLKRLKQDIKYDIQVSRNFCLVKTYSDLQSKEVLPEVAEYLSKEGYDIDLKNGEDYSSTNVLIINWQNKKLFKEEGVTE